MLRVLLAYDAQGNIIATLDHMVARDENGNVVGLIDFAAHEEAGGKLREVWEVSNAVGSATWPEWLGGAAYDFKVELDGKKAKALVHKKSGHRRERAAIEAEIEKRHVAALEDHRKKHGSDVDPSGAVVDLRDILGGPNAPLLLDEDGKTRPKVKVKRPNLPVVTTLGGSPRPPAQ